MRLFLAIPLSEEIRQALTQTQERLKTAGADVKWVEPENFHLTVSFLGDQEDALLEDIKDVCADLAAGATPFRIRVRGASFFPKRGPTIKTLWVAVTEGGDPWRALVKRAEPGFTPFGVPREGGLVPHITLGRVRSERNTNELREAVLAEAGTDCGAQNVDKIVLVQSTLDPRGATYEERGAWALTAKTEKLDQV